jgi:hypothetical protein
VLYLSWASERSERDLVDIDTAGTLAVGSGGLAEETSLYTWFSLQDLDTLDICCSAKNTRELRWLEAGLCEQDIPIQDYSWVSIVTLYFTPCHLHSLCLVLLFTQIHNATGPFHNQLLGCNFSPVANRTGQQQTKQ